MNDLQWYDFFRMLIAAIALWGMYRIHRLWRLRGSTWSPRLLDIARVFFGFLLLAIVGSIEQVAQNVGFGYRMIITFILVCFAIRATRYSDEPLQKF